MSRSDAHFSFRSELMTEPTIAMDGITYEKRAILRWMKKSERSPVTNEKMPQTLVANSTLKRLINLRFPDKAQRSTAEIINWLPPELLDIIFDYLTPHSLCMCAMVSVLFLTAEER